jgi:lipopolysaccharide transport system ATP-binding protein
MGDIAIRAENVAKLYRIGRQERYKTLRDSLSDLTAAPLRWLRRRNCNGRGERETIWALNDVSFEVRRGEAVGIIGRNGAGKSTLLKILSRITEPTGGRITVHGRVGSLLEVGTGFHPELTGRENVYLNGAILGMRRTEIARKFDDIVAFAEVAQFIDTPVKHYSSGMYMRLGFAVAAHLEPEILVVDEVLAVGDLLFQKKCLGKMGDITAAGRTVLFVSHNLGAVRNLCSRALLLRQGRLLEAGATADVLRSYLSDDVSTTGQWHQSGAPRPGREVRLLSARVLSGEGQVTSVVDSDQPFDIAVEYEVLRPLPSFEIGVLLRNADGIAIVGSVDSDWVPCRERTRPAGRYCSTCRFPAHLLAPNTYSVSLGAAIIGQQGLDYQPDVLRFEVTEVGNIRARRNDRREGVITPILEWRVVPGNPHAEVGSS